jgi:hypothetical protein
MNPRFFGDSHDLFKYDLIAWIMKELRDDLSSFTFIPMLTKNQPPKKKDIAGMANEELWNSFNEFRGDDAAGDYFAIISGYFQSMGVKTKIFKEPIFSKETRAKYFDAVRAGFPVNSLIFFDPDTGLQDRNVSEKHLSYDELKDFYSRMDERSIIMVYQHHYRYIHDHKNFSTEIAGKVQSIIGEKEPLAFIDDNTIMFLFLVKNPDLKQKLKRSLGLYEEKYRGSFSINQSI